MSRTALFGFLALAVVAPGVVAQEDPGADPPQGTEIPFPYAIPSLDVAVVYHTQSQGREMRGRWTRAALDAVAPGLQLHRPLASTPVEKAGLEVVELTPSERACYAGSYRAGQHTVRILAADTVHVAPPAGKAEADRASIDLGTGNRISVADDGPLDGASTRGPAGDSSDATSLAITPVSVIDVREGVARSGQTVVVQPAGRHCSHPGDRRRISGRPVSRPGGPGWNPEEGRAGGKPFVGRHSRSPRAGGSTANWLAPDDAPAHQAASPGA